MSGQLIGKTRRALGAAIALLASMTVFADYSPFHIAVRPLTYRPGCDLPESALEVFNSNPFYSYKVHVEGTYTNMPAGPENCVSGGGSIDCKVTFSRDVVLGVCGGEQDNCDTWGPQLPGCDYGPPSSCDNEACNSSSWCTTFNNLSVTITHYRVGSSGEWIDINPDEVVCVRGVYGNSPFCYGENVCSNPTMTDACVDQDEFGLCLGEE